MNTNIEIKRIRDRFYVIYNYVLKSQGASIFFEEIKREVDDGFKNSDYKKLKIINKEIDTWLVEMFKPDEKTEVLRLLHDEVGENPNLENEKRLKKIGKILDRGYIKTTHEYALIEQRIEEIFSIEEKKDEVQLLNKLIFSFIRDRGKIK